MKRNPDSSYSNDNQNVAEIRKVIKQQKNLHLHSASGIIRSSRTNSEDFGDYELDVPVKRFTPLPDIPRSDDAYFRTESNLITREINNDKDRPSGALPLNTFEINNEVDKNLNNNNNSMNNAIKPAIKETRYHFATKKTFHIHRLPALEKSSFVQAMDLDEDLPIIINNSNNQRRDAYTSPADRIISPIRRPQAPSPPASCARVYKLSESDTDESLN